jgi:hypothetical protein
VVHEVLGDVAHDLEAELGGEDAGVLALVFLQDVGLHRAAHVGQHPFADLGGFGGGGLAAVVGLLNFSRFWSMAVFMNIARMVGAGPLMVMDTEVRGVAQVEAVEYSTFMSSSVAMDTPELPTLP